MPGSTEQGGYDLARIAEHCKDLSTSEAELQQMDDPRARRNTGKPAKVVGKRRLKGHALIRNLIYIHIYNIYIQTCICMCIYIIYIYMHSLKSRVVSCRQRFHLVSDTFRRQDILCIPVIRQQAERLSADPRTA